MKYENYTKTKSFFSNVSRIIYWLPIIWKDRNWDDAYILIILDHKLKDMEKFYRGDNTHSVCALETADEIKHAQEIVQRLIDCNYLSVALEEYHKIYGDKSIMTFEEIEGSENSKLVWTEDEDQIAMFRKAGEEADKDEQKDFDELFIYLRKHIENWWD